MRLGLVFSLIFILTACSPSRGARSGGATTFNGSKPKADKAGGQPQMTYVATDWTPENVEVVCSADRCPIQVGALLFAGAAVNGKIPTRRCTAFLISSDTIVSNGHCDGSGKERGFFVSQRINGQKEVRSISGVVFKKFTPHPKGGDLTTGRPDLALFSLDRPIRGVPGLRLASGPQMTFAKLTAFAIMNSPGDRLSIEKHECQVRRHEAEFPFDMNEAPDMIRSYGCRLQPGTSGSPMFADGSEEVQAVQTNGMDPQVRANLVRETENRGLLPYEKHWSSHATNVRCLNYPGARPIACTVTDDALVDRRFREAQRAEFGRLETRSADSPSSAVKSKPYRYQLSPAHERRFEIIHLPVCRQAQEVLRTVPIVVEHVQVHIDEWGAPRTRSLSQSTLHAAVRAVSVNVHEMDLSWPAPPTPHASPESDLRKQWGSRFRIDLPVCPR